jgi:transglutaminase superfamily protein
LATWPTPGSSKQPAEGTGFLSEPGFRWDPWLLARVFSFAVATRLLVRLSPERLGQLVVPKSPAKPQDGVAIQTIARHVDLALRLGRPVVPAGCLTRGLTLYRYLSAAGISTRLRFGLGRIDGAYEGHCWLEKDGLPILENTDPNRHFEVMFSIP